MRSVGFRLARIENRISSLEQGVLRASSLFLSASPHYSDGPAIIFGGFPDEIQTQTDQLVFTSTKVNAVVDTDSSGVGLSETTEAQIDNIEGELMTPNLDDILRYVGLNRENCRIALSHAEIGGLYKIATANIKVFATAEKCEAAEDPTDVYIIVLGYDENGNVNSYKLTKPV